MLLLVLWWLGIGVILPLMLADHAASDVQAMRISILTAALFVRQAIILIPRQTPATVYILLDFTRAMMI